MAHLRIPQSSERRPGYEHPQGAQLVVHELVDPERMIWLVELALPNPQLVGGSEYELLDLPANAIDFDEEMAEEMAASESEALRTANKWLGDDVAVGPNARFSPRKLEHAA